MILISTVAFWILKPSGPALALSLARLAAAHLILLGGALCVVLSVVWCVRLPVELYGTTVALVFCSFISSLYCDGGSGLT